MEKRQSKNLQDLVLRKKSTSSPLYKGPLSALFRSYELDILSLSNQKNVDHFL